MGFFKRSAEKGVGYFKNEASTLLSLKTIKNLNSNIIENAKKILDPRTVKKGKEETFSNAIKRLNIDEKNLRSSYKNYIFRFYLGLGLFLLSLLLGLKFIISGNIFSFAPTIAAIAVSISLMFDGSFRCYQINRRELCSVKQWKSNFNNLLPDGFINDEDFYKEERKTRKKKLGKEIIVSKEK